MPMPEGGDSLAPASSADPPPLLPKALIGIVAGCLALALYLLWGFDPLPIVDLPQHAAQIKLLFLLQDPTYPFADQYEINYFTPYLTTYLIAAFFALALPVPVALKLILTLTLAFWLFAAFRFLRQVDADPWWVLTVFPLFFGLSFTWGFLNYLLSVPLGLWTIAVAFDHGSAPTRRSSFGIALLGMLTFFTHGMTCIFVLAISAALVALLTANWRQLAPRLLPFLAPVLVMGAWSLGKTQVGGEVYWVRLGQRLGLHRHLLGDLYDDQAATWGLAFIVLTLAVVVFGWHRLAGMPGRQKWAHRLPLLAALAYVAMMPELIFPLFFAGSRFVLWVPLLAGWWLKRSTWRQLPLFLVPPVVGWLLVLLTRFGAVENELANVRPLLDTLPRRSTLLAIRAGLSIPNLYLHQHAWYTVEKEGLADFSFAYFPTELVRYRRNRVPEITLKMQHRPWQYLVRIGALEHFDHLLVYAAEGEPIALPAHFHLARRSGPWQLYERVPAP